MRKFEEMFSYPWYVRLIFALQRKKYGRVLESARFWGRLPRTFLSITFLYRSLDRRDSPIEPGLRSLITVTVSRINGCRFCVDLNSATALERHVSPEKLADLSRFKTSSHYTERERIALRFAEAVTRTGDDGLEVLREEARSRFGEEGLLELAALVAFQNMSSKFNNALGIPPQGFCVVVSPPGTDELQDRHKIV